ncbi:hypothetical protein O9K63_02810 [Janibacter cremeus]|uniref:hypothetical protein n=1 Tax=Janibacter cremeus TaxID=1285192 RepID=UPI0023F636E6|nr:hypothetical protein [Janibacter cremeus]WEV78742.1 hypothetical protein O9K63_02810 [Janibacter cremeus]
MSIGGYRQRTRSRRLVRCCWSNGHVRPTGGRTEETFRNEEEAAFFNCIDCAPGDRVGLGVSDPVDGKFRIIRTTDGGASWEVLPDAGMPDSSDEVNFSASGDCLSMTGHDAWFGVGGEDARVHHSDDRGLTTRPPHARLRAVGGVLGCWW